MIREGESVHQLVQVTEIIWVLSAKKSEEQSFAHGHQFRKNCLPPALRPKWHL
jgi:hypothetical protein